VELHWSEVPDRLDDRTIRRIQRSLADAQFTSLRQQVYVVTTTIRKDMAIDIPDVELSNLFGHLPARILQSLHPFEKTAFKVSRGISARIT
jgi:hypothetical protein